MGQGPINMPMPILMFHILIDGTTEICSHIDVSNIGLFTFVFIFQLFYYTIVMSLLANTVSQ